MIAAGHGRPSSVYICITSHLFFPNNRIPGTGKPLFPVVVARDHELFAMVVFQDIQLVVQAAFRNFTVVGIRLRHAVAIHVIAQENSSTVSIYHFHLLAQKPKGGLLGISSWRAIHFFFFFFMLVTSFSYVLLLSKGGVGEGEAKG